MKCCCHTVNLRGGEAKLTNDTLLHYSNEFLGEKYLLIGKATKVGFFYYVFQREREIRYLRGLNTAMIGVQQLRRKTSRSYSLHFQ